MKKGGDLMHKQETWILVANSAFAKIFSVEKVGVLKEVKKFEHPESHLRDRDLWSDKPGRSFESMGPTRHALEPHESFHQQEAKQFARELTHYLEAERGNGSYQRLYVSASPTFLSMLRQNITPHTAQLVVDTLNKDLTRVEPKAVWEHIAQGRF